MTEEESLKTADDLVLELYEFVRNIIAGSDEECEYDIDISNRCEEYLRSRSLIK